MERREFILIGAGICATACLPKLPFLSLSVPIVKGQYLVSNRVYFNWAAKFEDGETLEIYNPGMKPTNTKITISKVDRVTNTIWFEVV